MSELLNKCVNYCQLTQINVINAFISIFILRACQYLYIC